MKKCRWCDWDSNPIQRDVSVQMNPLSYDCPKISGQVSFSNFKLILAGREPWSSGYGKKLKF